MFSMNSSPFDWLVALLTGGLLNNGIYAWKLKAVMEKFMGSYR